MRNRKENMTQETSVNEQVPLTTTIATFRERADIMVAKEAKAKETYETELAKLKADNDALWLEAKQALTAHYTGEWPTELEHQIIMVYGFDRSVTESVLAFDAKLRSHMGELIAVAHTAEDDRGRIHHMEPSMPSGKRSIFELGPRQKTDFFIGRISKGLSLREKHNSSIILLDSERFPADTIAWDNESGKIGIAHVSKALFFPSYLFDAVIEGKMVRTSALGEIEVAIGDEEIEKLIRKIGGPALRLIHLQKSLIEYEKEVERKLHGDDPEQTGGA